MTSLHDESEWESPDAYDSLVGRWSRSIAPWFVAWSGISPRSRLVLDVGSGTGGVASAVAARTGADVLAVDLVRKYLEKGGHAAAQADAMRLPLRDGVVDAVVSGLALPQMEDPVLAVREWSRVTRPGGIIAAYAWAEVGWLRAFWDAVGGMGGPPTFDVARALRDAGLLDAEGTTLSMDVRFESFDAYWAPFLTAEGPAPAHLASLAPAARDELREKVRARVGERPAFVGRITAGKARRPT